MVDYSKWDNIDADSDEDEDQAAQKEATIIKQPAPSPVIPQPQTLPMTKKGTDGRLQFQYDGRTIYEWDQTLEDVNIYVKPPPVYVRKGAKVKSSMIDCTITHQHVTLGLKGNPPFLNEDTAGPVKSKESYWMMEDGEVHIQLQKMNKGQMWPSALAGKGQEMDPVTTEATKKKLMLERFQEENPGFDFSNAEFNGNVPDPQAFMGGVKYP